MHTHAHTRMKQPPRRLAGWGGVRGGVLFPQVVLGLWREVFEEAHTRGPKKPEVSALLVTADLVVLPATLLAGVGSGRAG